MYKLQLLAGGYIGVFSTAVKNFDATGANIVLNYTDGTSATLVYTTLEEMPINLIG